MTDWLDVMLDEIRRKEHETEQARDELERRKADRQPVQAPVSDSK